MEIRIVTVGKIKEKYLNDGIAEYAKRLSRYCKLTFCQVTDEKTPDCPECIFIAAVICGTVRCS